MKKIANLFLLVAFVISPSVSFAQTVDMDYGTPLVASPAGNAYMLTTTLSVEGISSYNGLSFLVITYTNLENPPSSISVLSSITQSIATPNQFGVSIPLSSTPTGVWYQFALVDNASLNSVGVANVNPGDGDAFQTFAITAPEQPTVEDEAGDGVFTGGGTTGLGDTLDDTECGDTLDDTPCGTTEPEIAFLPTTTLANPLGQDLDIIDFLDQLFENFVKIALPILVLFTVYSGLLFVMARGNEEKISDAKKNFLYVIIGSVIVFGAWTVAHLLAGTVEQFEAFYGVVKLLV